MRRTSTGIASVFWAALTLPGCFLHNQAATDAYSREVLVATMRVAQIEASLVDAETRVAQLEETIRVQGQEQVTRLESMEQVNAEVGRIRGEIEVLRFDLGELHRALDALSIDHERRLLHSESRLGQIEKFLGVKPPPPPTDAELGLAAGAVAAGSEDPTVTAGTTPVEEPTDQPIPPDITGKLQLAVEHMTAGRQGVARVVLQKAAEEHAGAPEMSEVKYRIAETWFNEEKWSKAITAFQSVVQGFPESEWASWAMLRQGDAFDRMGQPENATMFYEEVVRVYPKSEAAKEAKSLLEH